VSSGFDRLGPALQYQIVNTFGFDTLRPVQEQAIDAILGGKNCVVLASTAGGKTESAFFPLLSEMDTQDWRPVSVVYVAPIRALLNNQEPRLTRYAQSIGRRVFKWHGDVGPSQRRRFVDDPSDILLTTPESLEVMLMSTRIPAKRLFQTLRAVVIDEVHAFVGDDRGGHLSALMERLSRVCGHDVQRIALSASVGNPDEILRWAAGSSRRTGLVVSTGGPRTEPDLSLDYVANLENAARMIEALHPGKKRLVFVDSRRSVEALGRALRGAGVETYVTHSSLAIDERQQAERAFAEGKECVIVATSALELGIDIGDLDHVIHIDCPSTVAAFLQRMGRSGRRAGMRPNCTLLATKEDSLVQAAGLLRLYKSGFVESVRPRTRAAHLLAHQLMALCIQEQGVPESDWWAWVAPATPFQGLTEADRSELLAHMLDAAILATDGGRLALGVRGEKLYGFRNFIELYSVFSSPEILTVMWGAQEIGTIDAYFAQQEEPGKLTFTLGARVWNATHIDWDRAVAYVQPVESGQLATWFGQPLLLHRDMCQAICGVLTSKDEDPFWSKRARQTIDAQREGYEFLSQEALSLAEVPGGFQLWTFAGGRANQLLAKTLEELLGEKVTSHNLWVSFRERAGKSAVAIRQALERLRAEERPSEADALRLAARCARGRLSKFQPCLPSRLESAYLVSILLDADGASEIVRSRLALKEA
jgi:ATP-dependent Lhr-like helicase